MESDPERTNSPATSRSGPPNTREGRQAADSTIRPKPAKPYADFPLFPHDSDQWAKKIRGKFFYFGVWATPDEALDRYHKERDYLYQGLSVPENVDGLTVRDVVNRFLSAKQDAVDSGDIGKRHFDDLHITCRAIIDCFGRGRIAAGLTAKDFEKLRRVLAKRYGPTRLSNEVVRTRSVFAYAYEACSLDAPIRFGPSFKKPPRKRVCAARQKADREHGARMFEPKLLRRIIDTAPVHMKAMVLLAINGGMGNQDVGTLPITGVDLQAGIIDYPRPKTAIDRRFPLWPETIKAMRESLKCRPMPKNEQHSGLFFITKYGGPWATDSPSSPVSAEFRTLLNSQKAYRKGLSFYAIRHTFRTIADAHTDRPAIDRVMGHGDHSMADYYREGIADERLRAVTNYMRHWLFKTKKAK